jgi:hypothetical protein
MSLFVSITWYSIEVESNFNALKHTFLPLPDQSHA